MLNFDSSKIEEAPKESEPVEGINLFAKPPLTLLQKFRRNLITGTLIIGPIALTIYLLYYLFLFLDGIFSRVMNYLLRQGLGVTVLGTEPLPGLGLITLVIVVLLTGWGARNVIGRWVIKRSQEILDRIPLVNNVYKAFDQISQAIFSGRKDLFKKAVLIQYPSKGIYSIGVITADTVGAIQDYLPEEMVSVFITTTPNPTTGFQIFVARKDLIELDMPIEDAMKIVISGGIVIPGARIISPVSKE